MPNQDDMHVAHEHPVHIYQDWGLFTTLIISTAMVVVVDVLHLPMPFLTLPSIF